MDLSRASLFEIPMWTAQFDEVVPFHVEMTEQVERLINSTPEAEAPRFLAHQTPSDPFTLPSEGWRILERLCNEAYSTLAKQYFRRWRSGEFHLRRWAISYGQLSESEKSRLRRDGVHNHLPALFSSIYYLRIPPEFTGRPEGGTLFVNPLGNLMDLMSPRTTTILPKEGLFVVFPSFVDHSPVPIEWDSSGISRIVVSSDVFYVSGQSGGHQQTAVIPAAASGDLTR
jgi:hypothetical protein